MKFKALHPNFRLPTIGSEHAGAFDLYMPTSGSVSAHMPEGVFIPLGFAAEVPEGHVALLLPRSGAGAKKGLALNNTCGVIDADYRGEWLAALRVHNRETVKWEAGDRLLQFLLVPVIRPVLTQVEELSDTLRRAGGFGSTGS